MIEILISIMILGIGVISLATLFPIGMVRLRNAQNYTRSAFLFESAAADLGARDLLSTNSFFSTPIDPFSLPSATNSVGAQWYSTSTSSFFNPWIQDIPVYGKDWYLGTGSAANPNPGAFRGYGGTGHPSAVYIPGEGLPCAYDPLWRFQTGVYPDPYKNTPNPGEARFGSGIGLIRNDPTSSTDASAHGLQRVTNLSAGYFQSIIQTFVSQEDLILQESTGTYHDVTTNTLITSPSTMLPDLNMSTLTTTGAVVPTTTIDWRYSWFFTGRQTDALSGATFDGDIAICENRQFGIDVSPINANIYVPSGETVVEAVWGFSSAADKSVTAALPAGTFYGSRSSMKTVILRWPTTIPDPDIRVGRWIADVTYERTQATSNTRFGGLYPGQRCYWYQISKRTDAVVDPGFTGDPAGVSYRRMTVWVSTPLKARTLLSGTGTSVSPVTPEAALIMPTVVNVVPRTVYTR